MLKFTKDFFQGITFFFKAVSFSFSKRLWWAYFVPFLLTLLFFIIGWYSVNYLLDELNSWVLGYFDTGTSGWLTYLTPLLTGITWVLVKLGFFIFFSYVNGYLILIVMSPLLAYLSEKTEKIVSGKEYEFSFKQFAHDVARGIMISIRNFLYEIGLHILIFIAMLIPILGQFIAVLSPIILFFVSSYFYGFSFIDYFNERRRMNLRQSVRFVRKNMGFSVALGSIYSLFLIIPFIGSLSAGLISVVAVIAATLWAIKINDGKNV